MKSMVKYLQRGLFIMVAIGLAAHAWPEGVHNLVGVNLLQCLNQAGMFRTDRYDGGRCIDRAAEFVTDELELRQNGTVNIPDHSVQTASRHSGIVQSLNWFIKADGPYKRSIDFYPVPLPVGLPEYEYALALRAANSIESPRSLEYFEKAVIYRPRSWPPSFYRRYFETLARVSPEQTEQISHEEGAAPATSPEIKVGHKDQPTWDVPIAITGDWQLQGLTVGSWTAFDHSLPVPLELFWTAPAELTKREAVTIENMIGNGGFELGKQWKPIDRAGWYPGKDDDASIRTVSHDGRSSAALVLSPGGPKYSPLADTNFIPIEPQTDYLLWSAWVDRSDGGDPMIFVLWLDSGKRFLRFEIPFQGNVVGDSARHYAGVIQVPQDAAYLQIKLHNWQASGEASFDDLLLFPVKPPLP